jgi:subtilisin family serine protease
VVVFTPGSNADTEARNARALGAKVGRGFTHAFPGFVATLTETQRAALAKNPRVVVIEEDIEVRTTGTQTNPTWGLDRVDQRNLPLDGTYQYPDQPGIAVYVIDTGVRADHAELVGRIGAGYSSIADSNGTSDCNGHGTHVAGTVAGSRYGAAKNAIVHPVRVLACDGSGTISGVIAGIDWAIAHHAAGVPAVANLSLGGGASSSLDTAINNLVNDGVSVVVAAGNSSADACNTSPARVPAAVTVAATDSSDRQASFSNHGKCVDLYAPGVSVASAWHTSTTAAATLSGTSMAAPHVAGAAALILGANPSLNPSQVAAALNTNATTGVVLNTSSGTPNRLLYIPTPAPVTEAPVTEAPVTEAPEATAPDAPTNVSASAGKRSASVSWTRGDDGGAALTSQIVHVYSGTKKVGTVTVSGSASAVTITGLRSKVSYSFAISAANKVGTSPESKRSNTVTVR